MYRFTGKVCSISANIHAKFYSFLQNFAKFYKILQSCLRDRALAFLLNTKQILLAIKVILTINYTVVNGKKMVVGQSSATNLEHSKL